MRYVKKAIVVEAEQWRKNGDHSQDGPRDFEGKVVRRYRHPEVSGDKQCKHCFSLMRRHGWIDTLEGGHTVCPGDWIITGVEGERYPCKPSIFAATYEVVPE